MQQDQDEADRGAQGMKRAGDAIGRVLNINEQNTALTPRQQMANEALQSSAKALCLARKGKGGKGADGNPCG
eukprot:487172-Pyramimonas_sp.AAC.1